MPHTKLPAGLEDNNLEIYRYKGDVNAVYRGRKYTYLELPLSIREPFQAEYIADECSQNCMRNDLRIVGADEEEEKFVSCRYGNWDKNPDLSNGITTHDAPNCPEEKNCNGFGIICKIPEGENGVLSKQQYFVTRLVAKGKLDKEIATELNIALSTVRTHLNKIREKLGVNNRIEISNWAKDKGII
jgi:DNA-binding CsgD family transcriptional regulator